MNRPSRKTLLTAAALSPGVAFGVLHEMAVSVWVLVLGLIAVVVLCLLLAFKTPAYGAKLLNAGAGKPTHHSLLRADALAELVDTAPPVDQIRQSLRVTLSRPAPRGAFAGQDDQIRMVLEQVMARWHVADADALSDDQLRELWLTERVLRASPVEAGAMARYFAAPQVFLAIRDRISESATA